MAKMLKIASVGEGIPLVFLHGWGLNSGVWQPSIELLQDKYQIITVDLPGFGINADVKISPYTIDNIALHIHQVIDKPAVYVGWSLGGLIATKVALEFSSKVLGLITIASSPCFAEQEDWPGIPANVLALFHQQLSQDTQKTINNFLKIQAMGSTHVRQDIKVIRDLVMQFTMPSMETLDQSLHLLDLVDQRALVKGIAMPYLRMYGKLDGLIPKIVIPQIDNLCPNSDKYIFDKASHAPFISHLEEFVEVLSSWIDNRLIK